MVATWCRYVPIAGFDFLFGSQDKETHKFQKQHYYDSMFGILEDAAEPCQFYCSVPSVKDEGVSIQLSFTALDRPARSHILQLLRAMVVAQVQLDVAAQV